VKLFLQRAVLRILHNPDNFDTESKPFSEWSAARKKSSRHGLTNHRHFLRRSSVLWSKTPPLDQWNSHRNKEIGTHDVVSEKAALSFRNIVVTTVSIAGPETLVENGEGE
jgi:hypothetical protein